MEGSKRIAYFTRISVGASYDLGPTIEGLRLLQTRHLLSIPFENLDIHWDRPIVLDTESFFRKIVDERRGGFCYELNGLFNELLLSLGFTTRQVSARVFNGTVHGPEFDHLAIIVTIGDNEYLADVGFGDFASEPLRLSMGAEQQDPAGVFVIREFGDEYFEVAKRDDATWKSQYIFKDIPRDLLEFTEMCDFQQYSPDSHFRNGKVCSVLTEDGRKTLTDKKFIVTTKSERAEFQIGSEAEFYDLLTSEFGIAQSVGIL